MASSESPPAAGSCIAATLAFAAGLAELTASIAGEEALVERARELQSAVAPLGGEDAAAYDEFLRTGSDEARARTIELPVRMAELAADIAELCAETVEHARPPVNADAAAGAILAEAAARAADLLVRANGGGEAADAATQRAARAAARA